VGWIKEKILLPAIMAGNFWKSIRVGWWGNNKYVCIFVIPY